MNVILLLEQNGAIELSSQLEQLFGIKVIGEYTSSFEALTAIHQHRPDAVILDLDIVGLDTHAFVKEVQRIDTKSTIIFLSSTDSFAVEAFRMNALDYLLKPVLPDRLSITVDKLKKCFNISEIAQKPTKVSINIFGTFVVMVGDNPVRWQTAKGAEIFAYLLLHQKKSGVDKWKIINTIWSSKSEESGDLNFRSSLSRLNQTLKNFNTGITIKNMQGSYRLEYSDLEVDAFRLEEFAKMEDQITENQTKEIEELLFSYDGDLFAGFEFAWTKPFCDAIRQNINIVSNKLCRYYISKKKFAAAETVISRNLLTNAEDREAHEIKLELLYLSGKNTEADKYYHELMERFHDKLGIELSKKIKKYQK